MDSVQSVCGVWRVAFIWIGFLEILDYIWKNGDPGLQQNRRLPGYPGTRVAVMSLPAGSRYLRVFKSDPTRSDRVFPPGTRERGERGQFLRSMQYNLAYNVSGHNVRNTTNSAIMLLQLSWSPGPSEKILFWQLFLFAHIKSSKLQVVNGQDQLLFTKPWISHQTCVLFFTRSISFFFNEIRFSP